MKKQILLIIMSSIGILSFGQNVAFDDDKFKEALVADNLINTDKNTEISLEEAKAFSGKMTVKGKGIKSLKGIEEFLNLTQLSCSGNEISKVDLSKNTKLEKLYIYNNKLDTLDLSNNDSLIYVSANGNMLVSVNFGSIKKLETIYVNKNKLANIDVSNIDSLKTLNVQENEFKSLDVSNNKNLKTLYCYKNMIESIDVSKNLALYSFKTYDNQLKVLDVSKNSKLKYFECYKNKIKSLDLSQDTSLVKVLVNDNELEFLVLANGKNDKIYKMTATGNAKLSCIKHDNGFDPTTNTSWTKDETAKWATACSCTENLVTFKDEKFKAAILDHGKGITGFGINKIDLDGDGKICAREAELYTGKISVSSKEIKDLSGIEAFVNVTNISCSKNELTTIDLSKNVKLEKLFIYNNKLESLVLDNNVELTYISCYGNSLKTIDVSKNIKLETFYVNKNQLSELNVTKNVALKSLYCNENNLKGVDLSKNVELTRFNGYKNQIESLDVSKNTKLKYLECYSNKIVALDLSQNAALLKLTCNDNKLQVLSVANGNNAKIYKMTATNNALLGCIKHDKDFDPTSKSGWKKDESAKWSEDCACTEEIEIKDDKLKAALLDHGKGITGDGISKIDIDGDGKICKNEASTYAGSINVSGKEITDLSGIEKFVNITNLDCSGNKIATLDLSKNMKLMQLNCSNNVLTSLVLANGNNSKMTTVDVSGNATLKCVQHDDGFDPNQNSNWVKDEKTLWAVDCDKATLLAIEDASMVVYPNPASKIVVVSSDKTVDVFVYNLSGKLVLEAKSNQNIDVSSLPKGVYTIKVNGNSYKLLKD